MRIVAFDYETRLIRPGMLAPDPVCLSFAANEEYDDAKCGVFAEFEIPDGFFEWLLSADVIVGANTAFDMAVMLASRPHLAKLIFDAYAEGRVVDVQLNQQLIDNALGRLGGYVKHDGRKVEYRYNLAELEERLCGRDRSAQKTGDAWRFRYHELIGVRSDDYPMPAWQYALDDSTGALEVLDLQLAQSAPLLENAPAQAAAAFALHLESCWGLKTNDAAIDRLVESVEEDYARLTTFLQEHGLVRRDKKQSRDTKVAKEFMVAAYERQGKPYPLTDTGDVCLDKVACEDADCEIMEAYAGRTAARKIIDEHVPALRRGVDSVIQPSYNVMVETGRTSCRGPDTGKKRPKEWCGKQKPPLDCVLDGEESRRCVVCGELAPGTWGFQIQNPPRKEGVRECFHARPGTVYIDTDFTGLELSTLAEVCIQLVGYSTLGEMILAGIDPHLDMASQMMKISYDEAKARKHESEVKHWRNASKPGNFGFPGMLGAAGFQAYARKGYGVRLTVEECERLHATWKRRFPEFQDYFKLIKDLCSGGSGGTVTQLFSNRVRGLVPPTAAANSFFQGLGSDGAKAAVFEVARACYAQPESPLYGTRPCAFLHDQILSETLDDRERRHAAAFEQARVMVEACNRFLPNVPVRCTPALSRVFTKGAEAVFDAPPDRGGLLVPYDEAKVNRWTVYDTDGQVFPWR